MFVLSLSERQTRGAEGKRKSINEKREERPGSRLSSFMLFIRLVFGETILTTAREGRLSGPNNGSALAAKSNERNRAACRYPLTASCPPHCLYELALTTEPLQ